jgi:hypothetical protein
MIRWVFIIALLLGSSTAWAEQDMSLIPVTERDYDAFKPKGLKLGAFKILPDVTLETGYNSNVYITESNQESDMVNAFKPSVSIQSDWNNHSMELNGEAEIKRFVDNDSEDQNNLKLSYIRSITVKRVLDLYGKTSFAYDHEDRDDILDAQSPASPFRYKDLNLGLGLRYKPGRNEVALEIDRRTLRFDDDVSFASAAIPAIRSDADRNETKLQFIHNYKIHDDLKTEIRLSYRLLNYERLSYLTGPATFTGFDQDSDVAAAAVGLSGNLFRNVQGRVLLGAERQSYKDAGLEDVDAGTVDVDLSWNPTSISTFNLGYDRRLETDNAIEGGLTRQRFSLGYDHELKRNILLTNRFDYETREFENNVREDTTYRYGLGGQYLFNDKYSLNLGANYEVRDSNVNGSDYDQLIFMLGLSRKF